MRGELPDSLASVTLRPAVAEDEGFLFELYASTRREEMEEWGFGEAQRAAFLTMQFRAQRQGYAAQFPGAEDRIVVVDGKAVGRLLVSRAEDAIRLVDVALLPELQGRGIGRGLVEAVQAQASRLGKPVRLHVLQSSRAARLYERLGFKTAAQHPPYTEMEWRADAGR
jgi:ribosomal protein S18 acetylase RimI-like enzyme